MQDTFLNVKFTRKSGLLGGHCTHRIECRPVPCRARHASVLALLARLEILV